MVRREPLDGISTTGYPSEADQKRFRASVYRWMDEASIDVLLALKGGQEGWQKYLEIGVYEPKHRHELWLIDETHIPIRCRGRRGQVVDDLYLISAFDMFSRLCLNQVTVGSVGRHRRLGRHRPGRRRSLLWHPGRHY